MLKWFFITLVCTTNRKYLAALVSNLTKAQTLSNWRHWHQHCLRFWFRSTLRSWQTYITTLCFDNSHPPVVSLISSSNCHLFFRDLLITLPSTTVVSLTKDLQQATWPYKLCIQVTVTVLQSTKGRSSNSALLAKAILARDQVELWIWSSRYSNNSHPKVKELKEG